MSVGAAARMMTRLADETGRMADEMERAAEASRSLPGGLASGDSGGGPRLSGSSGGGSGGPGGPGGSGGPGGAGGSGSSGPLASSDALRLLQGQLMVLQHIAWSWEKATPGGVARRRAW